LVVGKPFINNFLPNGGDMLRLNMAVPPTSRTDANFSSEGLLKAAVLGIVDTNYNKNTDIQFIPNMDGFPNGRRLEDDVTRIELQAVGGVVLAAIGLPFDDYVGGPSPVTGKLLTALSYGTGVYRNDTSIRRAFPYEQLPWSGTNPRCACNAGPNGAGFAPEVITVPEATNAITGGEITAPDFIVSAYPNPFAGSSNVKYRVTKPSNVTISVYDVSGKIVKVLVNQKQNAGTYNVQWNAGNAAHGIYFINAVVDGNLKQSVRISKQ